MLSVWSSLKLCRSVKSNLYSLPDDKILDLSCAKMKACANGKINVTQKLKFVVGRVENIVEKRRKCFFSHNVFKSFLSQGR